LNWGERCAACGFAGGPEREMKKLLLGLVVFLALLAVGGLLALDFALEQGTGKALEHLAAESTAQGIKVEFARFAEVGLKGLDTVQWRDIVASIHAPRYISFSPGEEVILSIGEMTLELSGILRGVATVRASDIGIRVRRDASSTEKFDAQVEGIEQGQLVVASLMDAPQLALQFLQEGRTTVPFGFKARSVFRVGGASLSAEIKTVKQGENYLLVMAPADLRRIAGLLKEELTDEEIRLLALHPLLAPALLKITSRARTQSLAAHDGDQTVPEDAYRHVLWSFLLTRAFGPAFAEKVTNAHEVGARQYNTEADHRMDYNNNAVGRQYARAGHGEDQILPLVMSDPKVIRSPR
jgi:hypothetical protein